MRWPLAILTVLALAGPVLARDGVPAGPDDPDASWEQEVVEERSWLQRLLLRYFGRAPRTGEALGGRTEQLVDRYAEFAGRTIEVVIVYPVLRFTPEPAEGDEVSWNTLTRLAKPLWSYTRESVVRQYLLFKRGDRLDPFRLADSERMLRQLEYMNDAQILVLPIGGGDGSVAVVVETRDRWPLGVAGAIHTQDRFDASIYSTNVAGVGLRFDNQLLVHRGRDPDVGYHGSLRKENLGGAFVDAYVDYEDSWRSLRRAAGVERRPVHPAIRWLGGLGAEDHDVRDNAGVPNHFERGEVWVGRGFLLRGADPFVTRATRARRHVLTPAVSVAAVRFRDRPAAVTRDTLRGYHERDTYLAGLTYEVRTDLKTSYLYRMGETEDLPAGLVLKATAGYEDGEFLRRTVGYFVASNIAADPAGRITWLEAGGGGYLREGHFEDGVVALRAAYITALLGQGSWRHRFFSQLSYLRGINRTVGGVVLGDRTGIRDLPNTGVTGEQRLVAKFESRLFTPWRVIGFDTMLFGYADVGTIGGEDDAVLHGKIYSSFGLGVRVHNADLVIPTIELRMGMVQNIESRTFSLAFDLGNMAYPEIRLPGVRPGGLDYQ